ncbi:MAG: sugar transferase [Bacteroidota bacterium]
METAILHNSPRIIDPVTVNDAIKAYVRDVNLPEKSLLLRATKRTVDIVAASIMVVGVLSWMYPILALIIWLETGSGPLFKQIRSGKYGKWYKCYKFRTMRVNAEADTKAAEDGDRRITKAGRFLRISGLDELPQFINVLKGEMSLVGPRPHMLNDNAEFRSIISGYDKRHLVKPGITGLAQVNSFKGPVHNQTDLYRRVEKDIYYVKHYSMLLDVKIVLLTFRHLASELTKL